MALPTEVEEWQRSAFTHLQPPPLPFGRRQRGAHTAPASVSTALRALLFSSNSSFIFQTGTAGSGCRMAMTVLAPISSIWRKAMSSTHSFRTGLRCPPCSSCSSSFARSKKRSHQPWHACMWIHARTKAEVAVNVHPVAQ